MSHHHKDRKPGAHSLDLNRMPRGGLFSDLLLAFGYVVVIGTAALLFQAINHTGPLYSQEELVYMGRAH